MQLTEAQRGLVTISQLADLGIDADARYHLVHGSEWERISTRVLRRRGSPATDEQRAMAAVLDAGPGARLMGPSAAAWWGVKGFDLRVLHVTRPRFENRQQISRPLGFVHQSRYLPTHHCTVFEGIPVVVPARYLFELAAMIHPKRAERAVDNTWTLRLVSGRSLHTLADEMCRRGRRGGPVMRAILSTRPVDYVPPASNLEARFCTLLADAGEKPMRRQVDVGDEDGWVGRVRRPTHDAMHDCAPLGTRCSPSQTSRSGCSRATSWTESARSDGCSTAVARRDPIELARHDRSWSDSGAPVRPGLSAPGGRMVGSGVGLAGRRPGRRAVSPR